MTYQYTPADLKKLSSELIDMAFSIEEPTEREKVLSRALEAFVQQLDRALAERDQARSIAVALEQEIAALRIDP